MQLVSLNIEKKQANIVKGDYGQRAPVRRPARTEHRFGSTYCRQCSRFQIEELNEHVLGIEIVMTGEGQRTAVWRPRRVVLNRFCGSERHGRVALGGDQKNLPRFSWSRARECDRLAIRRPMRDSGHEGGISQLKTFAAVELAAPERTVRISYIGDPFTTEGEIEFDRRNPTEIGNKLTRCRIVADQFSARLRSDDKELLAIPAWNWSTEEQRPCGELHRLVPVLRFSE